MNTSDAAESRRATALQCKRWVVILTGLAVLASPVLAGNIETRDGKVYVDAKITRVLPHAVEVWVPGTGSIEIPEANLRPVDLAKIADKMQAAATAEAEAEAIRQKNVAKWEADERARKSAGSAALPTLTTTTGKVYRDVVIKDVDATGLKITHAEGIAKVTFDVLSEELRTKYGFDPAKAAEAQAAAEIADAKRAAANEKKRANAAIEASHVARDWQPISFKILSKMGNGYLCFRYTRGGPPGAAARAVAGLVGRRVENVLPETDYEHPLYVTGIKEAVAIGQVVSGLAARAGTEDVDGQPYEHWIKK